MDKEEFLEEFEDYCYDNFDDKNFQKEVSSFFEKEFDESKTKIKTKTFLGIAGLIGL